MFKLCDTAFIHAEWAETTVLIEPGRRIDGGAADVFASCIESVSVDDRLIVVDCDLEPEVCPVSAVFTSPPKPGWAELLTASGGYAISIKKKLLGGFKFERQRPHEHYMFDVSWLLAAIVCDYQSDRNRYGYKVKFAKWT